MPINHVNLTYDGVIVSTDRGYTPYDAAECLALLNALRKKEQVFIDMVARQEKKQRRLVRSSEGKVAPANDHHIPRPEEPHSQAAQNTPTH